MTVVVIGAGPGGLAVAAQLRQRGIEVRVLDRSDRVGSSWRAHYERLHLHTVRWTSHLGDFRMPRSFGPWVARADVVRYLEDFAAHYGIEVSFGVEATRIERGDGSWLISTASGEVIEGPVVVVATGYNHTPDLPSWPGRESFTGELLHAASYKNPQPYAGRDVLVVGTGNSGAEIAVDLVEGGAARVRLAVRTPPTFVRREVGPLPNSLVSIGLAKLPVRVTDRIIDLSCRLGTPDLTEFGLPRPRPGVYSRLLADGAVPIIDVGLIELVQARKVEVVGPVEGFEGDKVLIAGGAPIGPDAVIAATGYRRGLEDLVGHLGVLDERGRPVALAGATAPGAPDLYFTGFTNPLSGMFRELRIDARKIARAITHDRKVHTRG